MADNVDAGLIIDFSNLNFRVGEIDGRVRLAQGKAKILESQLKQDEQIVNRIESRAQHLGKYLIKQQAKMAALALISEVVDTDDLSNRGARALVNIGMATAYGAMFTPGMPLAGAAIGLTVSTAHQLWHTIKEHEAEMIRARQVIKEEHDARQQLKDDLEKQIKELADKFSEELIAAFSKQDDDNAEIDYQTACAVED